VDRTVVRAIIPNKKVSTEGEQNAGPDKTLASTGHTREVFSVEKETVGKKKHTKGCEDAKGEKAGRGAARKRSENGP